jgi:glycosyltransferase involved in cell wall biosynthesis
VADLPSISLITATYNAAEHLPNLIESVRQQSDRAFEWIVIDGASQDGTLDLIRAAQDVITDYVSEPDFGFFHALNKGIQRATGDYYLVVGADDRLDPLAIANYKQAAASSQADLISAYIYSEKNAVIKPTGGAIWHHGVQAFTTTQSVGILIKRNLHERYGYYSHDYPIAADAAFILKVQRGGGKITIATSGTLLNCCAAKQVRLPNESLFIDAVDFDYCIKLRKKNYKIFTVCNAKINHRFGNSKSIKLFGRNKFIYLYSPLRYFYVHRNHTYLETRLAKSHLFFIICTFYRLFKCLRKILVILSFEDSQKFLKIYACSKGTIDGLLGKLGKTWT